MARTVIDRLAEINLADPSRPGGIWAGVEEVAAIIQEDLEHAHTGYPAPVIPITTPNRSEAA